MLIEEADIGKKKKKEREREIRRAYEVGIFFQAWQWLVRLGGWNSGPSLSASASFSLE